MYVEVFIDGACRNQQNPQLRRAACAVVVYNKRKEAVRFARLLGNRDHNEAEYEALITALLILTMSGYENPIIYSDSAIVVNQVNGKWAVKAKQLIPYHLTVEEIKAEYNFRLVQVSRSRVFVADRLCNKILDKEENYHV